MNNYIVATIKDWNVAAYRRCTPALPGQWYLVSSREELTIDFLMRIKPRYIFFPHWSWKVPEEILQQFECVCFHMTDVPYGRGGSPLQNLIVRGHKETQLTALRMSSELDAGPVYGKLGLTLEGRAQDIFKRMADRIYEIVRDIVMQEPEPQSQVGEVVKFERRNPAQSRLPVSGSIEQLYDHIRMLDADSYPKSFMEYGDFHLIFESAELEGECVEARVTIRKRGLT